MPKNCCGKNNQYHYNDSCSSEYYSDRSESYNCSGSVDYFTCDPCNFVCYKYPYQPQPPGPPGPPDGFTHLLLLSEYDADIETLFFSIENSILNGATIDAENVVVTIVPPDGAVIDIDSINVEVGSVELDADGNIIWTIGTLAMSDGNPLILSISDYPLPDEEVTWFASAVTTSNSDPNNTDDETELTIGGSSGLGHLDLNLQWDADGGADGEIVVSLLNDGELPAEDIEVILVASNITGLTTGDITPPAGTTVDVVDSGGFTQITWTINLLEAGDNIELRFPQREVLAPDSLSWEGIATTPSFTQTDGENESSILLGLAGFVMEANYDSSNDLVTFNSTYYNSDPDADPLVGPTTITITPDVNQTSLVDPSDITVLLNGFAIVPSINVDVNGEITIVISDDLDPNDVIVVSFFQPTSPDPVSWEGTITNPDAVTSSDSTPIISGNGLGLTSNMSSPTLTFEGTNNSSQSNMTNVTLTITPSVEVIGDTVPIIDVNDITSTPIADSINVNPTTGVITVQFSSLNFGDNVVVSFDLPIDTDPISWSAELSANDQQSVTDVQNTIAIDISTISYIDPAVLIEVNNRSAIAAENALLTLTDLNESNLNGIVTNFGVNTGVPDLTQLNVGIITVNNFTLDTINPLEVTFNEVLDPLNPVNWLITITATNSSPTTDGTLMIG